MDPRHPLPAGVRVQVNSALNTIIAIGPLVLLAALLSVPIYYLIYRYAPQPKKDVSLMRYVVISLLVAALTYVIGPASGSRRAALRQARATFAVWSAYLASARFWLPPQFSFTLFFWARNARRAP